MEIPKFQKAWNFGCPAGENSKIPRGYSKIPGPGILEFWCPGLENPKIPNGNSKIPWRLEFGNFGGLAWEISKFHWKFNNSREPGILKARLGKSKILQGNSKLSELEFTRNSRSWSQRRKPCSYVCWDSGRVFNPSGDATTRHWTWRPYILKWYWKAHGKCELGQFRIWTSAVRAFLSRTLILRFRICL